MRYKSKPTSAKMKTFSKYWSIFQITLINSLAYPGELVGRSLMIIPFMWIFYQLWKVTFSAAGADVIERTHPPRHALVFDAGRDHRIGPPTHCTHDVG